MTEIPPPAPGDDAVVPNPEIDEIEFSLDQLSEAYAKVLRGQGGAIAGDDPIVTGPGGDTEDPADLDAGEVLDPVDLDDRRDDAPCPITEMSVLEAILFVGVPPDVRLSAKKLASLMRDISPKEIPLLVNELNQRYEAEGAAYRITHQNGNYQLVLSEDLHAIRDPFYGEVREAQLTHQAVEVLAIVAYHQPVARSQVDKIRHRPSGAVLSQLCERKLLALDPASESTRDRRYVTTDRFLQLFGLAEIGDLPQAQEVDNIDEFFE